MNVIRLDHVSKAYPRHRHLTRGLKHNLLHLPDLIRRLRADRFLALDDVSLEAKRGEALGIIGPNGSGKSTMLGLIAGVIQAQAGTVEVLGRVAPLLELGAGFHYELTGRENIVLNAILLGLTRREVAKRLDAIVAFSGLEAFLDEPLRTYSSGMVARLGFSVAAHLDPDILLIDEILAVGDAHFQAKCHERLTDFRRHGMTLVIVSHAIKDIRLLCDRVVWLEAGRIAMEGEPGEVLEAYKQS
jgi:lipopolysaccharide transport system ATP-binding protein